MTRKQIYGHRDAMERVVKILARKDFVLVHFIEFQSLAGKRRASVYDQYKLFCFVKTNFCAWWLFCNNIASETYALEEGTRHYERKLRTSRMIRHKEVHGKPSERDVFKLSVMYMDRKTKITDSEVFQDISGVILLKVFYIEGGIISFLKSSC